MALVTFSAPPIFPVDPPPTAAAIFRKNFKKARFKEIFDEYIEDGSPVGRDGTRVDEFAKNIDSEIDVVIRKVNAKTYSFTSYREKLISKGAGKYPRQISIPTVRDKLVLKFLSELLADIYPENAARPPHEYVKNIHRKSKAAGATDYYLRLDIKNFYPSIDHKILMRILRRKIRQKQILHLIESAIKTPTGKARTAKNLLEVGVPQGLSISNILSSIYLQDIDRAYSNLPKVEYFRFVDDVLIIAERKEAQKFAEEIPKLFKRKCKIVCHKVGDGSKSILVSVADGIDYLGYKFQADRIEVRESSFKKMFSNITKLLTAMKYQKNKSPLIWRLNLRVTGCRYQQKRIGWLFFFSQSNNTQQLKQLDAFVTSHAKNVLQAGDAKRLKTFVRAYHEIRYNHRDSKYFPDFDNFDTEQQKSQILLLLPRIKEKDLDAKSAEEVEKIFHRCITREISDLERDMLEVFS